MPPRHLPYTRREGPAGPPRRAWGTPTAGAPPATPPPWPASGTGRYWGGKPPLPERGPGRSGTVSPAAPARSRAPGEGRPKGAGLPAAAGPGLQRGPPGRGEQAAAPLRGRNRGVQGRSRRSARRRAAGSYRPATSAGPKPRARRGRFRLRPGLALDSPAREAKAKAARPPSVGARQPRCPP